MIYIYRLDSTIDKIDKIDKMGKVDDIYIYTPQIRQDRFRGLDRVDRLDQTRLDQIRLDWIDQIDQIGFDQIRQTRLDWIGLHWIWIRLDRHVFMYKCIDM